MISDHKLAEWEGLANETLSTHQCDLSYGLATNNLRLIAEVRRLREQLKPDCLHGCIFKLARKIAEEGK